MGIIGNIGNLFKTSEQLAQEKRQRKRMLERGIERAVESLGEGQRRAVKDQEKFYQQAKQKLAVGRETEARQFLQFSRMQARTADNYTRQKLIFANALTQIQVAASAQTAAQCFSQLAVECGLNLDSFDNGLDSMKDVEEIIDKMNKAMSRKWENDSRKAGETEDEDGDASIDEMMERARSEVAAENGAEVSEPGTAAPSHA